MIGPRPLEAAYECAPAERRGQYGFLHLVTVEETVLGLMEKPRGVEVRGRGLLVTGKGNPESLARWAFVRPLSDAWRVEDGRMDKQVVRLSEARGD